MQKSWFKRISSVMEWSFVVRSGFPLVGLIFLWSFHTAWAAIVLFSIDGGDTVYYLPNYFWMLKTILFIIAGAALLLAYGYRLSQQQREPMWYQYVCATYFSLGLVWGGYITGSLSIASGVVLMGAPLFGFLILERRVVLFAFVCAFVALLILNYASAYHIIPYAPFTQPPSDQASAPLWALCQIMMAAPHYVVDVTLCSLVLIQWLRRETAVMKLSQTDPLTGTKNRRSMLTQLRREISRAQRQNTALSLVILDLDHFKSINDTFGHPVGDDALRKASQAIGDEIRAGDSLGRIGGEEFMLLLPRTTPEEAAILAERCRQRLTSIAIDAPTNKKSSDAPASVHLSGSFGVSWINQGEPSDDKDMVATADEALYRAKRNGRNCVVFAKQSCRVENACPTYSVAPTRNTPRRRLNWQSMNYETIVRGVLSAAIKWSPVNKARAILSLGLFVASNFYLWLFSSVLLMEPNTHLNLEVALYLLNIAPIALALPALTIFAGKYTNRYRPASAAYQVFAIQMFAMNLIFIGYYIGIANITAGVMLVCIPIVGFMIFERAYVIQVMITSVLAVIALLFASAYNVLPYAPLISINRSEWQLSSPYWVTTNYLASIYIIVAVLVLVDHILGRWREREEEIRILSITDALTGVNNRHSIIEHLQSNIETATRHESPIAVVMLDLDRFKNINDRWGHPIGDETLKLTCKALTVCLREGDIIGRFGGEEFLLVLPNTTLDGAAQLAERCRKKIQAITLCSPSGERIQITASLGISSSECTNSYSSDALIKLADDALYAAKNSGRNRVELAQPLNKNRNTPASQLC
ncbi:MAG: GGDEF domain-containing protein [Alcanivoracaceae bacterium]|nr:GGDEF domain-containing protein [Alcanivoracaceae bacterium]